MKRLGVNIDHIATLRNARGETHPSPLKAAMLAMKYGHEYTIEGDMDNYNELVNYIELNDLSLIENYNYIETKIDIDEIINYQILQFYIDNNDWPQNNYKLWRSNIENGKWRWILFDPDCGFGNCLQTARSEHLPPDPSVPDTTPC